VIDKKLYHKEFPPLPKDGQRTDVTVNVTISSIGSFDEIDMTFTAKFTIHLEWYLV